MAKKEINKVITYDGNNEELFKRFSVTDLPADAKIIVPETHNAILLKDGMMMDTLNSGSYDIFDSKKKKHDPNITVEVIYMSKTAKLKVNWGTRTQFDLRDTETDVPIKVGAHGEFEVQICNPRKAYLELIGVKGNFNVDELKERLSMRMMSKIEPAIAQTMREKNLSYDRMSEHKDEIAQSVLKVLSKMFEEEYGLRMFSFTLANVLISPESIQAIENARQAKKQKAEEEKKKLEDEKREEAAKAEAERLDDKNWEREQYLLELKQKDYAKYLEVCKIIGWESKEGGSKSTGRYCPNCGRPYGQNDKFCMGCGKQLGDVKKVCPNCKKENPSDAMFCAGCGTKL